MRLSSIQSRAVCTSVSAMLALVIVVGALLSSAGCARRAVVVPTPAGSPIYVQTAPPSPKPETRPPKPTPGSVWVSGRWQWNGHKHVWTSGHWDKNPKGSSWVAGHWVKKPGGWIWVDGHWR